MSSGKTHASLEAELAELLDMICVMFRYFRWQKAFEHMTRVRAEALKMARLSDARQFRSHP